MARTEEILDCLQLINSENVGPVTFYKLLELYHSAAEALQALPKHKKLKPFSRREAELELKRAEDKGIRILLYKDQDYPDNLRQMEDAPPLLYAAGNVSLLNNPLAFSIVGARNASINGRKTASRIAYDLTNNDVLIVSGMARGIDAAAHKGAMYAKEQCGPTAAVLGTGVDVPYPAENASLYEQIKRNGVIVSEFPLGTQPNAANFPRRNRIVAGLGLGTLVVEATLNSGSLITARLALEQGKDIFAIPGAPNEGRSAGPNKLIKDGANLAESADDILEILGRNNRQRVLQQRSYNTRVAKKSGKQPEPTLLETDLCPQKTEKTKIIDYLNHSGVYVDEIIRASGLDAATVSLELLELELSGKIVRQPGNKVALVK